MTECWCGSGLPYADCHEKSDLKLAELRKKGLPVPDKHLIKNAKQIEGIRKAGQINSLILDAVSKEIREGMTTQEIDDIVRDATEGYGGIPAPYHYEGFPKRVCTSVNDVICHGIPSDKVVLREGDIVNVDCTTIVDGFYGDASRMFMIGDVSPKARELCEVTAESVLEAEKHLTPYSHLGDIGYYINKLAREHRYNVVREIGGHGCGLKMHEDPYVCHIGKLGKGMVLCPGMVFTIEPMINAGTGRFYVDGGDQWQVYTADGSLSAQVEHMVLITEDGFEILSR